jgi:hypothetical protein
MQHVLESGSHTNAGQRGCGSPQGAKILQLTAKLSAHGSASEVIEELTHAELSGELPELFALVFRGLLGMIDGADPEVVVSYLEMAHAVAGSRDELGMISEIRSTYDVLCADPATAAERCLASIERRCQICGLIAS